MAWSDMEPKQKGMLVATIIVFLIIGYMVYKLFFAGSSPAPTPVAKAPTPAAQPQQAAPAANSAASDLAVNANSAAGVAANTVNTAPAANPAVPQVVEMPKRELTPEELNLLEERRQVQQQYLQLVNQYQLMEMQNKVATSQSTLIKTQVETAKAEQQASKLGILLPGQSGESDADKSLSGVTLVYVGQKSGAWSAVLNLRGQYVTVKLGSHLPDDSVVSKIDDNGIVLYKDGQRRTLAVATVVEQTSDDSDSDNGDGSNADSLNSAGNS
jgi:hypothetical protein